MTTVDKKTELIVRMLGVYEAPTDAQGNQDPKWQIYNLEQIIISIRDTAESYNLLDADLGQLKIVENPQIVFRADLTEYLAKTLSGVTLVVNSSVTGGTTVKNDHEISLDQTDYTLAEDLAVTDSKDINITARIKWRNTVIRAEDGVTESMTQPEIELSSSAPE